MIKNFHGYTLDLLGMAILSGRYAVGASLPPEPLLCEEFGVSRTVVREAVSRLAGETDAPVPRLPLFRSSGPSIAEDVDGFEDQDGCVDADNDGDTDGADFLVWQRNWTGALSASAAAAWAASSFFLRTYPASTRAPVATRPTRAPMGNPFISGDRPVPRGMAGGGCIEEGRKRANLPSIP